MNLIGNYEPPLWTLVDVVKRFREAEDHFFSLGAKGDMTLMAMRPHNAKIGVRIFSEDSWGVAPMRMPDLFKLEMTNIRELWNGVDTKLSRSSMGYQMDNAGFLKSFSAHDGWTAFNQKGDGLEVPETDSWRRPNRAEWLIEDQDGTPFLSIKRSDVRIHISEVAKQNAFLHEVIKTDDSEHLSTKLKLLSEAAHVFWGKINVDMKQQKSHPGTEEIIEWFMKANFSRSQAKAAASIIVPDGATNRGRPSKSDFVHKITKLSS